MEALTNNLADKVTVLATIEDDLFQQKTLLKEKTSQLEQAINKVSSKTHASLLHVLCIASSGKMV